MTLSYVLMQNLRRNPLRSWLTAIAFALPMAVFVAAISYITALIALGKASEQELRLGVHQKTTIVNMLPEGTRRKIEALDSGKGRLKAVCGMRWFGGVVPGTQNTVVSLGADADTFPIVYSDLKLSEDQKSAWARDHQAAVVGPGVANRYHWKQGDRVTLKGSVPPYKELEFHIVAVLDVNGRDNFLYFRRDYLTEAYKEEGLDDPSCNIFWIKCNSEPQLRELQREIDGMFANTPDETKTEDENAFAASFAKASGGIPDLMQFMAITVVVVISMVAGNTMMMSLRERMRELAVFKAIGFQARRVFTIVLSESLLLAMIGALLGIVPTVILLRMRFMQDIIPFGGVSSIRPSAWAVAGSLVIALLVGLAAGLWPAITAMRLKPVTALREVN